MLSFHFLLILIAESSVMGDNRQNYILNATTTLLADGKIKIEYGESLKELNRFLDDVSCSILFTSIQNGKIVLQNEISTLKSNDKALIFYKNAPEVITEENLHSNVLTLSICSSPTNVLYHSLQKVYTPLLLKENASFVNPKLQKLLNDLQLSIGSAVRKSNEVHSGSAKKITTEGMFVCFMLCSYVMKVMVIQYKSDNPNLNNLKSLIIRSNLKTEIKLNFSRSDVVAG